MLVDHVGLVIAVKEVVELGAPRALLACSRARERGTRQRRREGDGVESCSERRISSPPQMGGSIEGAIWSDPCIPRSLRFNGPQRADSRAGTNRRYGGCGASP